MIGSSRRFRLGLCAVTLVTFMSACSGGGSAADASPPTSNTPPPPVDNTPPTVSGIATPSSVSVVTATNSN